MARNFWKRIARGAALLRSRRSPRGRKQAPSHVHALGHGKDFRARFRKRPVGADHPALSLAGTRPPYSGQFTPAYSARITVSISPFAGMKLAAFPVGGIRTSVSIPTYHCDRVFRALKPES